MCVTSGIGQCALATLATSGRIPEDTLEVNATPATCKE